MKAKLETENAKALYKKRKQTVELVFGTIKSAISFRRFFITLPYSCKRIVTLEIT